MNFWEFLDKHIYFSGFVVMLLFMSIPSVTWVRRTETRRDKKPPST